MPLWSHLPSILYRLNLGQLVRLPYGAVQSGTAQTFVTVLDPFEVAFLKNSIKMKEIYR